MPLWSEMCGRCTRGGTYARGGTHIGKGYGDVPRSWPPFFQASRRSLALQLTLNAPLLCPLFSIFRKFLHFQPCFGKNSSFLDPNFSKFSFPRPPFFQENPLPRPYMKPAWHTPTKKSWVPPPGHLRQVSNVRSQKHVKKGWFFLRMNLVNHDLGLRLKSTCFHEKGVIFHFKFKSYNMHIFLEKKSWLRGKIWWQNEVEFLLRSVFPSKWHILS